MFKNNNLYSFLARCLVILCALAGSALAAGPVIYERESKFGTVVITDEGN